MRGRSRVTRGPSAKVSTEAIRPVTEVGPIRSETIGALTVMVRH